MERADSAPLRDDLAREIERAWHRIAAPGTWLDATERTAVAAETRSAVHCGLCRRRKAALSPFDVDGTHDRAGALSDPEVEVVHRLRTDSGRLTRGWYDRTIASGVTEERYVEIMSIVAMVAALDTFDDALGRSHRPLPAPAAGEPTRRRPRGARRGLAWMPTLAPEDVEARDVDPYATEKPPNVMRAMSLVPRAVIDFFDLDEALYLPNDAIRDFDNEYRALDHRQMELVAGRVSALNRCFY